MKTASDPLRPAEGGFLLRLRVTPKASANRIGGVASDADGNGHLKVSITTVPEKGKANVAVLKLLSKALKRPKTSLEVVSGTSDRNKVVAIAGDLDGDPVELERTIRATLNL